EQAFFARKNLTDLIAGHRRAARAARLAAHAPPGDPEGAAIFFDAYRFMTFSLVVPDHSAVPPHRVMGADEAAALLAAANLEPSSLPAIGAADPAAVWIGARDGQVVEITRDSLSVARAPYYRRVDEAL
ncbi:MAG TPA: DNA-directed RNA polymerase subunit RpoH/Rpb5 C-terminal domain-containing protein, partial [Elusimicrobiota bacterium]|nr:DNA-directed RNA polymerase subunit RpoH/Rpb5 C-terminal domain-containing protein [Elusimicrobiota bacterium]